MNTLERLKKNTAAITMIERAGDMLKECGFKEYLDELGRPVIYKGGTDINIQATQAARSAGFFECMDALFNFKDMLVQMERKPDMPTASYGGVDRAIADGFITKEEALKYGNNS